MTQCEHFETFVLRDICKILDVKNQIWSDFVAQTKPKAKCPFKAVPLKVINATIDFTPLTSLPIGGYTYITTYKVFKSIPNVRHKKQKLFCVMTEASVVKLGKSNTQNQIKRRSNALAV